MLVKFRFRFSEVFFGMMLAVAIFAMGATFWSSPYPGPQTQSKTNAQSSDRSDSNKQEIAWWQDPIAIFTLGLVFVGTVQAFIFYGQMRLIRKSLAPAEKAANAAQRAAEVLPIVERAYVFIMPELQWWDPIPHSSGGGRTYASRIGVKFRLENHGKTPAAIESIDVRLQVLTEPPDNTLHTIAVFHGERIIPSGGHWEPDLSPRNCQISEAVYDTIMNRTAAIWFYGSIYYKDVFGNEFRTRFRWTYSEVLEVFIPRGDPPHNERT